MPFENILGNEPQKKLLLSTVKEDRISHAYIFSGIDGIGKKLFALEFAKFVNCKNRLLNSPSQSESLSDAQPCQCQSCLKINTAENKNVHPDVTLLSYQDEKTIKVDSIKDVEEKIYLRPFESLYKVFIIDNAERMNSSAQNAFLKTLEEPPRFCIIILITSALNFIVPTIRSRCQLIRFHPLPQDLITEKLREMAVLDEQDARVASKIAGGSIGRAIRTDKDYLDFRKEIIRQLMKVSYRSPSGILKLCEYMKVEAKDMERHTALFDIMSLWLKDLLLVKLNYGEEQIINSDLHAELSEYVKNRSTEDLLTKAGQLEDSWYGLFRLNANSKIAYEDLLLRLSA